MQVTVEVHRGSADGVRLLTMTSAMPSSPLMHESCVGAGVRIGLDLMVPDRWRTVSLRGAGPVAAALLGDRAAQELGLPPGASTTADLAAAGLWIRLAVVEALDRWLQLPLDQSLIDAERAVARVRAAARLPDEPDRQLVIGEALGLGRGASAGLVRYLRRLGHRGGPVPDRLRSAVDGVVEGYAALSAEVDGPDRSLGDVVRAWSTVRAGAGRFRVGPSSDHGRIRPARRRPARWAASSLIDPRQVRARLLEMSTDPSAGEVDLSTVPGRAGDAVLVQVPAHRGSIDQDAARRLLVRLVDRRTADPQGQALLSPARRRTPTGHIVFEGTVPLYGSDVADLRADVFDALSEVPPASQDSDAELREVRRATVFLGAWRRLVASAQLPAGAGSAAARLAELAERVRPCSGDPDAPIFALGPAVGELRNLAAGGDTALREALRAAGDQRSPGAGPLSSACGAGHLLLAELASAHEATSS